MKNAIRIFLATLLMTFLMHAQAEETVPDTIAGTTKISAEELIKLVQVESNIILIDARKPSDHRKGYIEGSISLPDTDTSAKTLASHIPSKSRSPQAIPIFTGFAAAGGNGPRKVTP